MTIPRIKSWATGDTLTAAELNAEFDNIIDNLTPTNIDDLSGTISAMQETVDPTGGSLATDLSGELKRLRHIIKLITGETYWYTTPDFALNVLTTQGDIITMQSGGVDRLALGAAGKSFISDGDDAVWGDPALPANYLTGFILSPDSGSPLDDLNIGAGKCRDSTDTVNLTLSSEQTKQVDNAAATGDDAGGMPDALIGTTSDWLYVFAIGDGTTTEIGFDTSATAANLIADHSGDGGTDYSGYTYYRRLGMIWVDGSGEILPFFQHGDRFLWTVIQQGYSQAIGNANENLITLAYIPVGIKVLALVRAGTVAATPSHQHLYSPQVDDAAPSTVWSSVPGLNINSSSNSEPELEILTDTSARVNVHSNINAYLSVNIRGWIDDRGKDG